MNTPATVRGMRGAVAASLIASSMVVTPPALAQGEYEGQSECRGSPVRQIYMEDDANRRFGRLELYYSAAESLYCARMVHVGESYGKALQTEVELYASTSQTAPSRKVRADAGVFKYYAGPIGARAKCIEAVGYLMWKNVGRAAVTRKYCLS